MIWEFLHLAGIIIALGAVTVIDTLGFFSRKSKEQTPITIEAHHITKPLIWIGTFLMTISWLFLYDGSRLAMIKSLSILVLIINGMFLSFYISPRLDKRRRKNALLPKELQIKIAVSMVFSFIFWWGLVLVTVIINK
jgi:hypothetical protein